MLSGCGGNGSTSGSPPTATSATSPISTASAAPPTGFAQFIYPTTGQLGVDATQKFQWTAVSGAASYQLQVGSAAGANDLFDSGIITANSVAVPHLPASGTVYARVRVIQQGWGTTLYSGSFPRGTYVTFRTDSQVAGASFTQPTSGSSVDADSPISWQPDPLAQNYRLTIINAADGSELSDSGMIRSSLRVVPGLPAGAHVTATLTTYYAHSVVRKQSLSFTVGNPATSTSGMLAVARSLTAAVREMADFDNQPHDGTPLATATAEEVDGASDCVAFSNTLLAQLSDAHVPLQTRARGMCFNPPDCHELVEILDPDTQRWITLDATFGLYTNNSAGQPATVEEISAAARTQTMSTLGFQFLTSEGEGYAHAYYIDYPLLFMQVYSVGSISDFEQPAPSLQPYYDSLGSSVSGVNAGYYALGCAAGSINAIAVWDGTSQTRPCTNGFTEVFAALAVSLGQGNSGATAVVTPHRFVF